MAGHARFTALLDACVIFPVAVVDSLFSASLIGLYAPKWTTEIEAQWIRNLARKTGRLETSFVPRRDQMQEACPDWEVPETAWRRLITCL